MDINQKYELQFSQKVCPTTTSSGSRNDTKTILRTVLMSNIFILSLICSRKNCYLSINQQGQTHVSTVTKLSQREASVILSAVSVSANAARQYFVTQANGLNLDTVNNTDQVIPLK